MNLVDSHSHLFLEEFAEDLPAVMARAREAGVTHIFMPNIDSTTIAPMNRVCTEYAGYCFPMVGLHPTSVNERWQEELDIVARELEKPNGYVAIGEIGMDLYWDTTFEAAQRQVLERQLAWALQYDLPVVLHCREAFGQVCDLLEPYKETSLRGIFHSFMGSAEEARRLLTFPRFLAGVNGAVTFKKSTLPEVLPAIPLERIVLETDAPYLSPVPYRGRRNESAYLKETLAKVAAVYGEPVETVARITSANALKVFGMFK
ncbi:MAG: TatD family hydrolase [Prevotellaceae bacterium]|nr:TatD family hydrolase [Prevotellaceae bacterium]